MATQDEFQCSRCGTPGPRLPPTPYPGATGDELSEQVCADCWAEWLQAEVIVINEMRLNFMEPDAQGILALHMREFLLLDKPQSGPSD